MITIKTLPVSLALVLIVAAPAAGQPMRLADALREADAKAFANRQARAGTDADRARAAQPLRGMLPAARVEGGLVRTTDPIGAFGTTLRQRAVSPAAFDPARLNDPSPVNNVVGSVVLEVPVFNGDAIAGWKAARTAADASAAMTDWTAVATRASVARAWFGSVLAAEKVAMLEEARTAAQAGVRQVEAMVRQGLVTKADALQASVRAGEVTAELLQARNDATTAGQQLAMLLGRTTGEALAVPSSLPADSALRHLAAVDTTSLAGADVNTALDTRDDVHAAHLGLRAARADEQRALGTLIPRLNGFARYDYNSPTTLYAGKPNWTVGVMGSWSLFGGASELADLAGTRARRRAAAAGDDAARTNARVEADAATRAVRVALERLDLAALNEAQSREAFRLVDKRYQGGLATIAERLGAETAATGAALAHAAARYALIDALVMHRRALGADPGALAVLDSTSDSRGVAR
ncbi:MAG: TolC family protein [Gemmatimonadaceae bacterium]|nr:TolC family protein [Gemmatimonadaceae bacterium]